MQSAMLDYHLGPFHFKDFVILHCLLNKFCCLRENTKTKNSNFVRQIFGSFTLNIKPQRLYMFMLITFVIFLRFLLGLFVYIQDSSLLFSLTLLCYDP